MGFCGRGTVLSPVTASSLIMAWERLWTGKHLPVTEAKIRANSHGLLRLTAILTHSQHLNHTPVKGMRRFTGVKMDESEKAEVKSEQRERRGGVSWCRKGQQN